MESRSIDLHTHTSYSDGSASPTELIRLAAGQHAAAIAITDHDNVAGLTEGRAAACEAGIEFINGLEISADYQPGTMHILGYYIDDRSARLNADLTALQHARETRNPKIAGKLRDLGFDIDYEEVASLAGGDVVGRPHFAKLMVEKGYATSIKDAFDRFLAKGGSAYVEKKRLAPPDAIDLIHHAGGVAVLAHPYQLKLESADQIEDEISRLAALGLDGIEAIYSRHSPEQRQQYQELAVKHGLLVTGGSDFHGSYKPDINIVRGLGDLQVPYPLLEPLKARAAAVSAGSRPA
ncbi:MAG TPA: PHP domain-containing protein [Blastocatellia bacterium]|nr:PHP domain-containing protein [Blastocatellia bacterium]